MFISQQYDVIFNMSGEYWDELSYQAYLIAKSDIISVADMMDAMHFQSGI